jgi:site-specific recombinase XerD
MIIAQSFDEYLETVQLTRSQNTYLAYTNGIKYLRMTLISHGIDPAAVPVSELSEKVVSWFATDLKSYAPASEQLYITAIKGYLEFLVAENLADINLSKVKLLIKQRTRKPGKRLPQFPAGDITQIIESLETYDFSSITDQKEKLRALRDKSFILTLADTGLRVHEACNLRRGDMDWREGQALVIGKGNRQAVVRFSSRAMKALKDYFAARAELDGSSGRQLGSLPLFARHDKGAGKKVLQITPTTGRNIVTECVREFLGDESVGTITPHSFRHYFVTKVLQVTGNLKLAQNLARHKNIEVTQRYAHLSNDELDKGYWAVFEE